MSIFLNKCTSVFDIDDYLKHKFKRFNLPHLEQKVKKSIFMDQWLNVAAAKCTLHHIYNIFLVFKINWAIKIHDEAVFLAYIIIPEITV